MRRGQVTVTILAAALVVVVTTVSLGVLGLANYLSDRNWEWRHLRSEGVSKADELSAALSLPMWNFDRPQIERVIESQMHDPDVQAVVVRQADVSAPGGIVTYGLSRNEGGDIAAIQGAPQEDGLLVEERRVSTPGGDALGTVQVYMTPRVINAELKVSLFHLIWAILLLDVLLSASLYFLLWRAVLRPLKEIERYAVAVRAVGAGDGTAPDERAGVPAPGGYICRELRSLQDSITHMVQLLHARMAALQKNEAMLSTVLNSVPHCIFWKDARGVYVGCNEVLVKAVGGRDASAVVGKTDFELPWPRDEAEAYREADQEVLQTNRPKRHIIEQVHLVDGSCRWAETTKVPLVDEHGMPSGILGVAEDITERKEAEDAFWREKAFNDAILHGMPGVLFLHDEQGRLIKWNSRALDVYGYTDEELKGKHFLDWVPADQKGQVMAAVQQMMRHGHVEMEGDVVLKGGTRVPHYITGIRLMIEGKPYMLVVGIDVAERKRAEEALRREKAINDAMLFGLPGVVGLYDDEGRLVKWNPKLADVTGLSDDQLKGRHVLDWFPPEQRGRIATAVRNVMRDGHAEIEADALVKEGGWVPYYHSGVRLSIEGRVYLLTIGIDISERKRAEEALLNATRYTEQVIASVQDGLVVLDRDLRYRVWNPKMEEITGLRADEVLGKSAFEAFPFLGDASVHAMMRRALAGDIGSSQDFHYRIAQTGREGWSWQTVGPLRSASGEIVGVISTIRDTTERKEAEEAVRREKAVTEAVFDSVPGLLYLYDDRGHLLRWNRKAREISGYSDEELSQFRLGDPQPAEEKGEIIEAVRRALRDGHAVSEASIITKGGHRIPFYFTAVRTEIDGRPHLVGVGIDITERKHAEEALRQEKALTDAVFDNVPAILCLFDEQGRAVRWNAKGLEISGYTDAEVAGATILDWQPTDAARGLVTDAMERVMRDGRAEVQKDFFTKGGERIPFYFTAIRLTLAGKPHVLTIGVDIREQKRAEEELRQALGQAEAANRAKDHFLAAASHELRTPLTPVLLLSSSLERDPSIPAEARRDLAIIREHIEVEKRLIGDLLDFTAIHAGKLHMHPVPTDIHDVLHAAVRTCQEEAGRRGQRLDVQLDARHHSILGDPDRLRQVFWNLMQNACKFTPEGGTITIRTSDDGGQTVRVEVTDSGMGMSPETLQKLFRPFEQGPRNERMQHYGGLGLGLAISKTLVEAHGGSISAMSPGPDRGSTFVVRLPVTAEPIPQHPAAARVPGVDRVRLKLLLVEDHELTLKTLRRLLVAEGHEVGTAMTMGEALKVAEHGRFDMVLSDIGLPDGSGCDLMPILRDRYGLQGIALSGFGADGDLEASRRAGFLAHLTKPVTIEALHDALAQFAAGRRATPTVPE